jgi:hypothetical protein
MILRGGPTSGNWAHDGPPASDPNPDATMAKEMTERFGGKVLRADETEVAVDGVN